MKALILILVTAIANIAAAKDPPGIPASMLMPDVTVSELCKPGYTARVRKVTEETKKKICAGKKGCIVDHVIPLEIGGSNDISNLAAQTVHDAHEKDVLENKLHRSICIPPKPRAPTVPLSVAQWAIWSDWGHKEGKY